MSVPSVFPILIVLSCLSTNHESFVCNWSLDLTASLSAGPGYSVSLGDKFAMIQYTTVISQPDDFKGHIKLIQSELPELSSTTHCLTNLDFNLIGSRFTEQHWISLGEN